MTFILKRVILYHFRSDLSTSHVVERRFTHNIPRIWGATFKTSGYSSSIFMPMVSIFIISMPQFSVYAGFNVVHTN